MKTDQTFFWLFALSKMFNFHYQKEHKIQACFPHQIGTGNK